MQLTLLVYNQRWANNSNCSALQYGDSPREQCMRTTRNYFEVAIGRHHGCEPAESILSSLSYHSNFNYGQGQLKSLRLMSSARSED